MRTLFLIIFLISGLGLVSANTIFENPNLNLEIINKSIQPTSLVEGRKNISARNRRAMNNFLNSKGVAENALIFIKDEVSYKLLSKDLPLAMSPGKGISRSLLGMVVGKLVCEKKIESLDDPLSRYLPLLINSPWGNSSIRNLLLMKSGIHATNLLDHGFLPQKQWANFEYQKINWLYAPSFHELLVDDNSRSFGDGEKWNYSNLDSIALGLLVDKLSNNSFIDYFLHSIWSEVGAAYDSAWIKNANGQALYFSGFRAHPEDWVRFGVWVLRQMEKNNDCFSDFLTESLSTNVQTVTGVKYGFHKWVNCGPYIDFCFIGDDGQYLLFNRKSNVIMFATSANIETANYIPAIFQEFIPWEDLE